MIPKAPLDQLHVWRHNGAMPTIQIKNVPEATHQVWRRRAAAANQSLQEYLLQHLESVASRPTLDEALERLGQRTGGHLSIEGAARMVRDERDCR